MTTIKEQIFFKLALDNQVSKKTIEKLKTHYEVVFTSGDLADEIWIEEALALGANVFVSPDLDIPNYLDRFNVDNVYWIDLKQKLKSDKQFRYLRSKLCNLEKVLNDK